METYPLYTQVETDYLHETKYLVDVIGFDIVKKIADSILYAKKKHPHFAEIMTDGTLDKCRESLNEYRHSNDLQENCGCDVADEILNEEYLEAMEQHLLGNKKECIDELCQTIAVLVRMVELEKRL